MRASAVLGRRQGACKVSELDRFSILPTDHFPSGSTVNLPLHLGAPWLAGRKRERHSGQQSGEGGEVGRRRGSERADWAPVFPRPHCSPQISRGPVKLSPYPSCVSKPDPKGQVSSSSCPRSGAEHVICFDVSNSQTPGQTRVPCLLWSREEEKAGGDPVRREREQERREEACQGQRGKM